VIEKGYLYIAQPPLYKAKKGNRDRYLKNEQELAEYLLSAGLDSVQIRTSGKVVPSSSTLAGLKAAARFSKSIDRHARRLHPEILRGLIHAGVTAQTLESREKIENVLKALQEKLEKQKIAFSYQISRDGEHTAWNVQIESTIHGSKRLAPINVGVLESPEFDELHKHFAAMQAMGSGPYELLDGEEVVAEARHGEELAAVLVERAKQGMTVQRYKGLGEMNPEQLWETTMDPARRTLLQVSVDDAVEADSIFSVLMGDQVEPRRQFIEENALRVRNLDV
jgi:DNA gyrase subunit B